MNFKVGEQVVCVDGGRCENAAKVDSIYTIKRISECGLVLFFEEIPDRGLNYFGYRAERFRKLNNSSTSKFRSNSVSRELARRVLEQEVVEVPRELESV